MKATQNFYTRSALFVVLSLTGAVINYLLYPVLARIFNLSDFGDYVTIVGLSNQVMGILLAFSVLSIAFVKQYGDAEAHDKTQTIQKVLLWVFMAIAVVVLLISPYLQNLLKIQHAASFFVLALILLLAVPANIWTGFLQGHKEQIRVGIFNVSTSIFKFALVIALSFYAGVVGGLWGFWLSSLFGLIVLYYLPGKHVPTINSLFKRFREDEKAFLKHNRSYIAKSIMVVASLVFLQNYDLIRVKALFDPTTAGVYSGISVFSNALYFIAFLLIWILLPEFSINNKSNNRRVLRTAYMIIGIISAAVITGGLLLGNKLLPIVLGGRFSGQGRTLVVASLYQISLVSVALYAFYLLVLHKKHSALLSGLVFVSCLVVPLPFTSSPFALISSLLVAVAVGTVSFAALTSLQRRA